MTEESFKIYGTTTDGKMLISAEEVQVVISRELAVAGEEIERLKAELEELHCEIAHSTRNTCLACEKYVLECKC